MTEWADLLDNLGKVIDTLTQERDNALLDVEELRRELERRNRSFLERHGAYLDEVTRALLEVERVKGLHEKMQEQYETQLSRKDEEIKDLQRQVDRLAR